MRDRSLTLDVRKRYGTQLRPPSSGNGTSPASGNVQNDALKDPVIVPPMNVAEYGSLSDDAIC